MTNISNSTTITITIVTQTIKSNTKTFSIDYLIRERERSLSEGQLTNDRSSQLK